MRPLALIAPFAAAVVATAAPVKLEYNRDVRPILSDKCFKCHGPDSAARKAELRLDIRDNALAKHENGIPVVPGKPDESGLLQRIETDDPDDHMPPKKSNLRLSKNEIAVLRRWIAEGAEYQPHWSLIAPRAQIADRGFRISDLAKRDPARAADLERWPKNPIDDFVLDRLLAEGLAPSSEADPATLIRRMSLDLTGLPPTPTEVEAFVIESLRSHSSHATNETNGNDVASDAACAHLADRLLASPRFGERMALNFSGGAASAKDATKIPPAKAASGAGARRIKHECSETDCTARFNSVEVTV